jgi:hypothetical protein
METSGATSDGVDTAAAVKTGAQDQYHPIWADTNGAKDATIELPSVDVD